MWKHLVSLAVAAGIITGGVLLYQNRNRLFRPSFDKVGGTRLVYEVDGEVPSGGAEDAVKVLQRRFDPTGSAGIDVRARGEREVVIQVPHGDKHKERVEQVKRLVERAGKLEFRVFARSPEDAKAFRAAEERLRRPGAKAMNPPPPPRAPDGSSRFTAQLPGEPEFTYGWARLSTHEERSMLLDEPSMRRTVPADLPRLSFAMETGQTFSTTHNPELIFAVRKPDEKADPVYYTLTRASPEGEAITGDMVERVIVARQYGSRYQLTIRLNREAGQKMFALTSRNLSMSHDPTGGRRLAVMLDGEVLAAERLTTPLVAEVTVYSSIGLADAEDFAMLIRGGTLPAKLKLTQEEEVAPR